ncbi:MAG: sensor histidine kinase [Lachnospiraceae bacterium]
MFRLEDRQLHILIGLLCVASVGLLCFFGMERLPNHQEQGMLNGLSDFSEGWIASYKTTDGEKLKQYRSTEQTGSDRSYTDEDYMITEIVNLPVEVSVSVGEKVTLTHKVPDMGLETVYLTLKTDQQAVSVYVGQELIYESRKSEESLPVYHVIPIDPKYRDAVFTIELTGTGKDKMKVNAIQTGTYTGVLVQAFMENGTYFVAGIILLCISICLVVVWLLVKNTERWKKLLLYCNLEGMALGSLFLLESRLVRVLAGWDYGIYFLQSCLIIIAAVLHLTVIRSFVYKKKVLFLVDMGILFYGIFYISVMVLQGFSLIRFDDIYRAGMLLFVLGVLLYTIALGVAIYDYGRKEGKQVFFANVVLLLCLLAQVIMWISGRRESSGNIYVIAGVIIYMVIVWICGMRQAFRVENNHGETVYDEEKMREQIIEQFNPNLLFASFQTLQNLIKNGSDNSVKMIYYISVYVRDNLRAMSQRGEIISFEEELEHIIAYLQLQKTRNHNLEFAMECKVKNFQVPRHSIEPLVENAVKYGIAGKENRGNVVIRTYQREEGYAIQVIDDGIGFDKRILKRQSQTAILNLFAMLEKTCKAKTELITKEGKGTVITIILPMLENDLMAKDLLENE